MKSNGAQAVRAQTSNGRPLIPYMRQSRAKERTISIEEQRRDIRRWAEGAGVTLAPEVVEQNVSGSKPWRERALGAAVDACERGEAAGIIVAWQDRLSRENGLASAEVWEALKQARARLVSASEGLDTATVDQELTFTIRAAIARDQWKRYGANFERAKRHAFEEGVSSARTPIGYCKPEAGKPFELGPDAPTVLEAFRLRAEGEAFSRIARRFGWSHSTTRQILCNRVYLGEITLGGEVKENAHPAIVTPELFAAVQASRTVQPVPAGDTTRDRLLLGLSRCSSCGRTLKVVRAPRAGGRYVVSYYCKNAAGEQCPERAYVHADELDAFVAEWFTAALESVPRMIDVVATNDELEEARTKLAAAEAQLNAFVEKIDATARGFTRGYEVRLRRVNEAEERVSHLAGRSALAASLPPLAWWDRFDVFRRRTVLAGFLGSVVVKLGASSDLEGSVQILWRDGSLAFPEVAGKNARTRKQAA
jgi:DNA invertase Pin-like site-specific DNA recombinase